MSASGHFVPLMIIIRSQEHEPSIDEESSYKLPQHF